MKDVPTAIEDLDIEFVKLKDGLHTFRYTLGKLFFEAFENTEVLDARVELDIALEKFPAMIHVQLHAYGTIQLPCDRCLEGINMPVDTQYRLVYKLLTDGERVTESDSQELIFLKPQEIRINLAQPVYESVLLDVPMIRNCDGLENKPCNQEMLKKLDEINQSGDGDPDPRWDKLKDLLK
ncbi:MAG: DUF177 domain-containing protein [Bacteroidetes bacterium]|nr:DUF177 domain-containing protein [Bacteroidota bacterium]